MIIDRVSSEWKIVLEKRNHRSKQKNKMSYLSPGNCENIPKFFLLVLTNTKLYPLLDQLRVFLTQRYEKLKGNAL
jgi:hypothetical protein